MNWEMVGTDLTTYRPAPTVNVLADPRYALKNIGNNGVSVQNKFGLENKSVTAKHKHAELTLKT